MPRTGRSLLGGYCYHVLNRGNGRQEVFHNDDDYAAFLRLLREASERVFVRLLAYCLMPNHFHLVLWPRGDGDVSRWMQWFMTAHVRRYHRHYHSSGHVWQRRKQTLYYCGPDRYDRNSACPGWINPPCAHPQSK